MNYDFLFAGIAVYSNERDLIATYYRALIARRTFNDNAVIIK